MEYKTYTHPGQPEMQVEVILASQPSNISNHKPVYTIRLRYPRVIHSEIMTHRVFGRNARSSRAVPVKTMLNEVRNTPYVPWHWGKNQKGMQADEECKAKMSLEVDGVYFDDVSSREAWLMGSEYACNLAEAMMLAGFHKQNPNRLLEPYAWIDTLITSTEWDNFLWLRDHKDAEPHLQDLARLVKQAIDEAHINTLFSTEWHLPYITSDDVLWAVSEAVDSISTTANNLLCKVSAARCARISYKPFDGDASYDKELARYDLLVSSDRVHASPLEHQALPDVLMPGHEGPYGQWVTGRWSKPLLHGNLNGYIQARKLISNECYTK